MSRSIYLPAGQNLDELSDPKPGWTEKAVNHLGQHSVKRQSNTLGDQTEVRAADRSIHTNESPCALLAPEQSGTVLALNTFWN
jgi:hypothetical protein